MKSRCGVNSHVLLSIFSLVLTFIFFSNTSAQTQISPNPNPSGNLINIISNSYNDLDFENYGMLHVGYGNFALCNRGTFYNYNTLFNDGIFRNVSTFFNKGKGIFKGEGTFTGNLDSGIGTIAPGSSAGTMVVEGDYTLKDYLGDSNFGNGSGTLEIEIGGFGIDEFDLLEITGTAFMDGGTIDLMFIDGYDIRTDVLPGQTMALEFLTAGTIDSFASMINYDFLGTPEGFVYDVYLDGNSLWFSAENTNAIPAPGAIILASIGIGFVIRMRKRKIV
jgi:hypothetical protein